MTKLTPKQENFCHEYLIDFNGTQAAIRAGYSRKTANEQAGRLLVNVSVSARIAELTAKKTVDNEKYIAKILEGHEAIIDFDIAEILVCEKGVWSFKPLGEWSSKAKQVCSFSGLDGRGNPMIRIDKHSAREALAKAIGLYSDFNQAIACLKNYGLWVVQSTDGTWSLEDRHV